MTTGEPKKGLWKHFRGGIYIVDGVGIDTVTGGRLVIYHSVDNGDIFCRPLPEWFDSVELSTGEIGKRFEFLGEWLNEMRK